MRAPALLGLLLAGCAAPLGPAPVVTAAVVAPAAGPPLHVFTDPVAGLAVALPDEPLRVNVSRPGDKGAFHMRGLRWSGAGKGTVYEAVRVDLPGLEAPDDGTLLGAAALAMKQIGSDRALTRDGYRGRALEGSSPEGEAMLVQALAVGGSLYLCTVTAPPDKLDRPAAERFFESFQLDLPWRLHASTEGRFTISVPAPAIEQESSKQLDGAELAVITFAMGGERDLAYAVGFVPIDPTRSGHDTPEQILEGALAIFEKGVGVKVEHREMLRVEGQPAAEVLTRNPEGALVRGRLLFGNGILYLLMVSSKSVAAVGEGDAGRFFDSFRMGEGP